MSAFRVPMPCAMHSWRSDHDTDAARIGIHCKSGQQAPRSPEEATWPYQ